METKTISNRNVTPLRQTGETAPRIPPHNYEAEMALLGAILANNLVFDKVNEFLLPACFPTQNGHSNVTQQHSASIAVSVCFAWE